MVQVGRQVLTRTAAPEGARSRPRGITACAVYFAALGILTILAACLASFRPDFAVKPFFDFRMTGATFRLFGSVMGIGALYLAYAFWTLQPAGLVIYCVAVGLQTLSHILYFNVERGMLTVFDLAVTAYILSQWKAFFRPSA